MKVIALFFAFALASCVGLTPQEKAHFSEIANRPIFCDSAEQCKVKWGRAILWVSNNSKWKIRNQTDSIITTEGPFDKMDAAFVVNRIPLGQEQEQIVMQLACGDQIVGCIPPLLQLKASFVAFVNGDTPDTGLIPAQYNKR